MKFICCNWSVLCTFEACTCQAVLQGKTKDKVRADPNTVKQGTQKNKIIRTKHKDMTLES